MEAYIQDLCGDENPADIDCAILQCLIKDAILEQFRGGPVNNRMLDKTHDVVWDFLSQYNNKPAISVDLTLKRGDEDGKTIHWVSGDDK